MIRALWKFTVPLGKPIQHSVPAGGIIRHVALDHTSRDPALWIEVDPRPDAPTEIRTFNCYGTGHLIEGDNLFHRGTVQDGHWVWHLFETVDTQKEATSERHETS